MKLEYSRIQFNKNRIWIFIIFAGFFVVLLLQHRFMYPFLDDYGYASLSFKNVIPGVEGTKFNISQFFEFYWLHYVNWGGRVTAQSLATITLSEGIWAVRIVQGAVIAVLFYFMYRIVLRHTSVKPLAAAVIICCLWGLLEIFMIYDSIFWLSASVNYLWPLLPMLAGCWWYYGYVTGEDPLGKLRKFLTVVFLTFTATAQEQLAVAAIFVVGVLFIVKIIKAKKISLFDGLVAAGVIGGLLFLMLAPSMALRAEALKTQESYMAFASLPLLQRTALGYETIIKYLFSSNFYFYILALLFCGFFAGLRLLRLRQGIRILNKALIIASLGCFAVMVLFNEGLYSLLINNGAGGAVSIALVSVLLGLLVYGFIAYYIKSNKKMVLLIYLAAWVSLLSIIPVILPNTGRLYIPFVFLSFVLMGDILSDAMKSVRYRHMKVLAVALGILVIALNMTAYTARLYRTSGVQEENDVVLKEVSIRIRNGEDIRSIDLKYYPNIEADVLRPNTGLLIMYDEGTVACIKEYYDLPADIVINWFAG